MDCGTALVKYILFIFNTIVSVLGILAIVYGAFILHTIGAVEGKGLTPQAAVPIGLITLGSIVLFIAFLGCFGAIRENICMTMCYAVVMLTVLILQLIMVIMIWTNKEKITAGMGEVIDQAWKRAGRTEAFETIQKSFKCCGSNSYLDYGLIGKLPPKSCCDSSLTCSPLNYYGGCKGKFVDFMSGSTDKSKYFGIGLIVVELVGFIFACCLANNVRNYYVRT